MLLLCVKSAVLRALKDARGATTRTPFGSMQDVAPSSECKQVVILVETINPFMVEPVNMEAGRLSAARQMTEEGRCVGPTLAGA